jgi:prophage regulatory protein
MRNANNTWPSGLPAEGYIRLIQLIGMPGRPGVLPVSRATLWRMVRRGSFPAPVRLAQRVTAWRVEEVRRWLAGDAA